jgi:hypothetical protein
MNIQGALKRLLATGGKDLDWVCSVTLLAPAGSVGAAYGI